MLLLRPFTIPQNLTNMVPSCCRMLSDPFAAGSTYDLTPCRPRPSKKLFPVTRRSPTSAPSQCTLRATPIPLSIVVHNDFSAPSAPAVCVFSYVPLTRLFVATFGAFTCRNFSSGGIAAAVPGIKLNGRGSKLVQMHRTGAGATLKKSPCQFLPPWKVVL
ncbi:hypothetical protein BD310DRAFT_911732 [Dichomitus squalens]|uniref:Uncharacterized protein n=1 Tax=Dichomitus squalens TaxID=114155 RepID=A0A4V2K9Y1_9APHY|nr:hypothetical protein BD310DRAFT_911732 [Dichomitus squalens]